MSDNSGSFADIEDVLNDIRIFTLLIISGSNPMPLNHYRGNHSILTNCFFFSIRSLKFPDLKFLPFFVTFAPDNIDKLFSILITLFNLDKPLISYPVGSLFLEPYLPVGA